jgi:1-acyl-sn-glycerol-3-phosphate acyltransferase
MTYGFYRAILRVLFKCLYRFQVTGAENVPAEGGVILAANHASFLDPLALGTACPRPVTFVARGSLNRSGLYRLLTKRLPLLHVDPRSGDRETMRRMQEELRRGAVCGMFPEGTRTRDGRLGEVRRGFALLAGAADVPVVPVWISGTFEAWPAARKLPRPFGRVRVAFGRPFRVSGAAGKNAVALLADAWQQLVGGTGERTMAAPSH